MSEEIECTPPALLQVTKSTMESLIPSKSHKIYEFAYERFMKWAHQQNVHNYTENVMLTYFSHLAEKMKSSTLWSQYSMIKAELNIKHNIQIEKYTRLITFLKRRAEGYKPKKSKVLTKEQFDEFLHNAPDRIYLATKVILIFGITGACRSDELRHITVDGIKDFGELVLVKIPNSKTHKSRSFTIIGDYYINIYRKYAALRPKDLDISRFFIKYVNGRCHRIVIGIHKISNASREVASYLKLPNPTEYTGHCLRRTATTFQIDNDEDISSLKRDESWKLNSVTDGDIEESLTNKKQTALKILTPAECNKLPGTSIKIDLGGHVSSISTEVDCNLRCNLSCNTHGISAEVDSNTFDTLKNSENTKCTSLNSLNSFNQNCILQKCTFNNSNG